MQNNLLSGYYSGRSPQGFALLVKLVFSPYLWFQINLFVSMQSHLVANSLLG